MKLQRILAVVLCGLAAGALAAAQQGDEAREAHKIVIQIDKEGGPPNVFVGDREPFRIDTRPVRRGFLGVTLLDLTPELRRHFGSDAGTGVLVSSVVDDSPAARAGIEVGDLLTRIDDQPVDAARQVVGEVAGRTEGDRLRLQLIRAGSNLEVEAEIVERERAQVDLGSLFWCEEGEPCPSLGDGADFDFRTLFPIDPQRLDEAMRELDQEMASREWRQQVFRFRGSYEGLETRIQELEAKLLELQRQLEQLPE